MVRHLREIIALLSQGVAAAEAIGEALLHGRTLAIWRKVLLAGPAALLDLTLETLKQYDGLDACVSVAWMPASALAAAPRRAASFASSGSIPRVGRAAFRKIASSLITSSPRPSSTRSPSARPTGGTSQPSSRPVSTRLSCRERDGTAMAGSSAAAPSFRGHHEIYLRRNRVLDHAFSETDRLTARPREFRVLPQAGAVATCWRNWH